MVDTRCIMICSDIIETMRPYLDAQVPAEVGLRLHTHIGQCDNCRAEWESRRKLYAYLRHIRNVERPIKRPALAVIVRRLGQTSATTYAQFLSTGITDRCRSTPWWIVSVLFHGLLFALAGLISMEFDVPVHEESLVLVTDLCSGPGLNPKFEQPHEDLETEKSVLNTPLTASSSKDMSDILVSPEILPKAEMGDHFETINLDRPDTGGAFGSPDAHMFHRIEGSNDVAGGGGTGGLGFDDLIGFQGNGQAGVGGGWGGGKGSGSGIDIGAGQGSFGQRNAGGRKLMIKRFGGSLETEGAVERGLAWLAKRQRSDGSWSGQESTRNYTSQGDAAITGLATLAFLGAGHNENTGKYKDQVRRAVGWLIRSQHNDKNFKGRWSDCNYTQGIATMALAEAAGMSGNPAVKNAAQIAVDGIDAAQIRVGNSSEREAWDYTPGGNTDDSSIMAWNVMALKSARIGGLRVDSACFQGALNWIDAAQDCGKIRPTDTAPFSTWKGGHMSYRGVCGNVPKGRGSVAIMAAAALCRMVIGAGHPDQAGVLGPCNVLLAQCVPTQYPIDLYFGYYATLLMFQKGGEHWSVWNQAIKKVLINGQARVGSEEGSWAPFGHCSSRVMSTALGVMCLEVYYRYLPLYAKDSVSQ